MLQHFVVLYTCLTTLGLYLLYIRKFSRGFYFCEMTRKSVFKRYSRKYKFSRKFPNLPIFVLIGGY